MHGPCLSLAGADGIGNAGSGIGVARPATRMQGMRAGHAAPAISPRRFVGRHRAACFARLSAGLRTRGYGRDPSPHHRDRCFPGPPPQCLMRPRHHLPLRGSAGMGATSLDARRTGFPFHPAACGCRNRRPQHIGHGRIRHPIRVASPASPCGRLFALRNRPWRSQPCIPVLRKNTRPPHKRKAGRSPLSSDSDDATA